MRMQWNDTESKCIVHLAENFPRDEDRLETEIAFEDAVNVTLSFDKHNKRNYIGQIANTVDLEALAKKAAEDAMRKDI